MTIGHFALWVQDLETMKAFYERYFGAQANAKYVQCTETVNRIF